MVMSAPAAVQGDWGEDVKKVLLKNGEEIDKLFSKYKYHVLKSALRSHGEKQLCLIEDVRNKDGQLILNKGIAQTETALRRHIGNLLKHQLEYPIEYYIDVIHPQAAQKINDEMQKIVASLARKGVCDFKSMNQIINAVVSNYKSNHTLLNRLSVLKEEYVSGFNESMAVAIIATSIGQELGYRFEDQVNAFTAGLFHHIGEVPLQSAFEKERIPYEEVRRIKDHPTTGYLILNSRDIPDAVKNAVLKHHLFLDGSGYPNGLSLSYDDDLAMLINISSALITMCTRGKRPMKAALKLLDIYSRSKTRCGEEARPLYDRSFFEVLRSLNLSVIEGAPPQKRFNTQEIRNLHNTYVKLRKINADLDALMRRTENYVFENATPAATQETIDTFLFYTARMKTLTSDTQIIIGADQLETDPNLVADLFMDLEVIILELGHYLSFFEETTAALCAVFADAHNNKIVKKASHISIQIRYQLPKRTVDSL